MELDMSEFEKLYYNILQAFDSLWSFKVLDSNTIEIITPYSTTTSKFVSLFLTKRRDKYVVSDGGLLSSESYDTTVDYENQCLLKSLYHFESFYEIKMTNDSFGIRHYYKSTDNVKLIPNIIYDLAQFISICASTANVKFEDDKEINERATFRKNASAFISSNYLNFNLRFYGSLDKKEFRSVRFGAILERRNRLNLVNFITGSTSSNFINSIAKTSLNFEIAGKSAYNDFIDNKEINIKTLHFHCELN